MQRSVKYDVTHFLPLPRQADIATGLAALFSTLALNLNTVLPTLGMVTTIGDLTVDLVRVCCPQKKGKGWGLKRKGAIPLQAISQTRGWGYAPSSP